MADDVLWRCPFYKKPDGSAVHPRQPDKACGDVLWVGKSPPLGPRKCRRCRNTTFFVIPRGEP